MTRRPSHREHHEALTRLAAAVAAATDRGQRLPCAADGRFVDEDADTRTEAARACATCPVVTPCAAVAPYEATGIWGGIDAADRITFRPRVERQRTP